MEWRLLGFGLLREDGAGAPAEDGEDEEEADSIRVSRAGRTDRFSRNLRSVLALLGRESFALASLSWSAGEDARAAAVLRFAQNPELGRGLSVTT